MKLIVKPKFAFFQQESNFCLWCSRASLCFM